MKNVTHSTVGEVKSWLNDLEDTYAKFDRWIKRQKFNYSERKVAETIFDFRFGSVSMIGARDAHIAIKAIGDERAAEVKEMVKRFAIRNGLATKENYDNPEG